MHCLHRGDRLTMSATGVVSLYVRLRHLHQFSSRFPCQEIELNYHHSHVTLLFSCYPLFRYTIFLNYKQASTALSVCVCPVSDQLILRFCTSGQLTHYHHGFKHRPAAGPRRLPSRVHPLLRQVQLDPPGILVPARAAADLHVQGAQRRRGARPLHRPQTFLRPGHVPGARQDVRRRPVGACLGPPQRRRLPRGKDVETVHPRRRVARKKLGTLRQKVKRHVAHRLEGVVDLVSSAVFGASGFRCRLLHGLYTDSHAFGPHPHGKRDRDIRFAQVGVQP